MNGQDFMNQRSNLDRPSRNGWLQLKHTNCYAPFNPGCTSQNGRSWRRLLSSTVEKQSRREYSMAGELERPKTDATLHQSWHGCFLRGLEDERNSFWSLTVAEMDEWRLAMRRWLSLVIVSTRGGCSSAPPAKTWGEAAYEAPDDPSWLRDRAWEAAVWLGIDVGGYRWWWWGKMFVTVSGWSFYRAKSHISCGYGFDLDSISKSKLLRAC
jgi:hypothetical protein